MKHLKLSTFIVIAALIACNDSGKKKENSDDVTSFLNKAISGGMMEIELGKIAQNQALEPRVKNFGAMMVTDHTQAGDELKALAEAKGIAIHTMDDDHQKDINDLKNKTGVDFDKAYLKMMLKDHRDDIGDFEEAAQKSGDEDLKALAAKILPTLKKHLDSAKSINKKVKASMDPNDMSEAMETFPQR